jgi:hypoxanthine phosphoribosyltransferase
MEGDIERVIIPAEKIARKVAEIGARLADTYARDDDGITIVPILAGSIIFLADLIRHLPMKMRVDLVTVTSYHGRMTRSSGASLLGPASLDVRGRDVLIVDDILDTGRTLSLVQSEVEAAGARSVRTAVLLRKPGKSNGVVADFVGFDIQDLFVVGYGLDYGGLYRNLPYIAVLKAQVYEP